jgi:hypothetical protein
MRKSVKSRKSRKSRKPRKSRKSVKPKKSRKSRKMSKSRKPRKKNNDYMIRTLYEPPPLIYAAIEKPSPYPKQQILKLKEQNTLPIKYGNYITNYYDENTLLIDNDIKTLLETGDINTYFKINPSETKFDIQKFFIPEIHETLYPTFTKIIRINNKSIFDTLNEYITYRYRYEIYKNSPAPAAKDEPSDVESLIYILNKTI